MHVERKLLLWVLCSLAQDLCGLSPVPVMNLLIALMGGSYENVEERGSEEGLRKRAELIVKYETLMTAADRQDEELFPKWLHFFIPEDDSHDQDANGE